MASHASLRRSRPCVKRHDSFDLGSFYTLYEDLPGDEEKDNIRDESRLEAPHKLPDEGPWLLISHKTTEHAPSPFGHSHETSAFGAASANCTNSGLSKQQRSREYSQSVPQIVALDGSPYGPAPPLTPSPSQRPNDTQHLPVCPTLPLPVVTRNESRFSEFVQEPKAQPCNTDREPAWRKYVTVLGGFLACAASLGFLSTIPAFQVYVTERYPTLSPSEIVWLSTCQVFFFLIGGVIFGPLTDRFGPRLVLVAGAIFSCFGCAATSFATQFWFFLGSQGVLLGLGASLGFLSPIAGTMQWSDSRRATWVGVALSGAPAGALLWPVVVRIVVEKKSWKIAWLAIAAAQLLLLGLAALLVRAPSTLLLPAAAARGEYTPLDTRPNTSRNRHFLQIAVFRLPAYSLSIAGSFFIWVGILYLLFHLSDWTRSSGISVPMQNHMPTIISGSSFVGSLLLPLLADLAGRCEMMALCAFSASVLLLGSIPVRNPTATLLVGALYGFTTGGAIALQAPVLVEAIDDPEMFGTVLGQGLAGVAPAALIGPPLYGLILRAPEGGIACAQVVAGFCMAIGGILLIYARLCSGKGFFQRS